MARMAEKLSNKSYRDKFVAAHLKAFLASQIRELRGNLSQAEFGKLIGKPQSVVSRLENESYGQVSVKTLIEIAVRLDIALFLRFVSFQDFLVATYKTLPQTLGAESYNQKAMDELSAGEIHPDWVALLKGSGPFPPPQIASNGNSVFELPRSPVGLEKVA